MRALLTDQGTACPETALCEDCHVHEAKRRKVEVETVEEGHYFAADRPCAGTWTRVDGNPEIGACIACDGK